jgi:hypothetical protein
LSVVVIEPDELIMPALFGEPVLPPPVSHGLVPAAKGSDKLAEGRLPVAGEHSVALLFEAALTENRHTGNWRVILASELEAERTSLSL